MFILSPVSRAPGLGGRVAAAAPPLPGILTRWKQAESTPGDTSVPLAGMAADGWESAHHIGATSVAPMGRGRGRADSV